MGFSFSLCTRRDGDFRVHTGSQVVLAHVVKKLSTASFTGLMNPYGCMHAVDLLFNTKLVPVHSYITSNRYGSY